MLAEDIETFFDRGEFAVDVLIGDLVVSGIFSEEPVTVNFVETIKPVFICRADDVPGVMYDTTIANGSVVYKVKRISKDETGRIATLGLELQ